LLEKILTLIKSN